MVFTAENPEWEVSAKGRLYYRSREHQQSQFRAVAKFLPTGRRRLLDVGCGYGDFIPWLPSGYIYEGIDDNPDVIESARKLYPGYHFRCSTRIVNANVIVCIAALQNEIVDPAKLVRSMLSHCRLLVLATVAPHKSKWDHPVEEFFPAEPDLIEYEDDFMVVVAKGTL